MLRWKRALQAALLAAVVRSHAAFAQAPPHGAQPAPQGAAPVAAPAAGAPEQAAERPPSPPRPIDLARAARGKAVYARFCVSCHGARGDGRGSSARFLSPQPRDFTRGIFKCRSTPNGTLPRDEDLLRTLREGFAHTNMPPWAVLGERNLRDVVEHLKTFSPRWKEEGPGEAIPYAPEPPDDAASRSKGLAAWNAQGCFNCHGQTGQGDGPAVPTLYDDWGNHAVPFDFTSSPHRKCGDSDRDLYRTFLTGLGGTPMPSYAETLSPEDAWHLVHFLKTLSADETAQGLFHLETGN